MEAMRLLLYRASTAEIHKSEIQMRELKYRLSQMNPGKMIDEIRNRSLTCRDYLIHGLATRLEESTVKTHFSRDQLQNVMARRMDQARYRKNELRGKLNALNPLSVLNRGYALVTNQEGHVIVRKDQALQARNIFVRFTDGRIEATVQNNGE